MRRLIGRILTVAEYAGIVTLSVSTVVVVFYAVLVRYLPITGTQMAWTEEVGLLILVWLAFMGIAAVHREGGHFGVDLLKIRLAPRLRLVVTVLTDVLSLAFLLFVTVNAFTLIRKTFGDASDILHFPKLLLPLALFICGCLMMIYSGRSLVASFRRRQ